MSITPIDTNEDETVGIVKADRDTAEFEATEGINPELLIEFAERCQGMGWEYVTLAMKRDGDFPLLAFERHEDHGLYVGLAPVVPDEEVEDDG